MKTRHPHAALMIQFAKEFAEDIDAYKNWEYSVDTKQLDWKVMDSNGMSWESKYSFRKKQNVIIIGDIQVPVPETVEPEYGTRYYYPAVYNFSHENQYSSTIWDHNEFDEVMLMRGFVHLTKEAAIAHTKAIIALTALPD